MYPSLETITPLPAPFVVYWFIKFSVAAVSVVISTTEFPVVSATSATVKVDPSDVFVVSVLVSSDETIESLECWLLKL